MKKSNELTRAELEIMNVLWDLEKGTVNAVLEQLPNPKPAYNTVLTFLRILKAKGYVQSEPIGRQHCFYPIVQRNEYVSQSLKNVKNNIFRGSVSSLVNFFVKEEKLSASEIEDLITLIRQESNINNK